MSGPTVTASPALPWWRHRMCWLWPVTLVMVVALWRFGARREVQLGWMGLNAILAMAMILWAIGCLPVTFKLRGSLMRWAFWPALLETLLRLSNGSAPVPSGVMYLVMLLAVFPLCLLAGLVVGVMGAGGGIMACESSLDRLAAARSGIRWIWITVLAAGVVSLVLPDDSVAGRLVPSGVPWLLLCEHPFIARGKRRELMGRLEILLARRLRWRIFGFQIDLRAEAFAAAGFLLSWGLVSLKVFAPLQASSLLSTVQVLNATELKDPSRQGNLVLLEWDSASLRAATTEKSEAAIQARLVLRLAELGARRVVLPTPALFSGVTEDEPFEPVGGLGFERPTEVGNEEAPIEKADSYEIRRTENDLTRLASAMKTAGNVILLAPDGPEAKSAAFERLAPFAREVAQARIRPYQHSVLPVIPMSWPAGEPPCAAVSIFAAQSETGDGVPAAPVVSADGTATFGGKVFPLIDGSGELLVNLYRKRGAHDFAHVRFGEVMRGEPQLSADTGNWEPPSAYFRDKIVFLPPLRSPSLPGPFGALEPTALLAHATRTLSDDSFLHPVGRNAALLWSLAWAFVIGRVVMRRDPLKAGWRLLVVLAVIIATSLLLAAADMWLDPVLPSMSALASFLLVTQLSFSLERAAKERNRTMLHRFLDPEIARELLDSQNSRLGLGGDRENVVILFADVRGFSRFAENHPPEDVMRVVNAYLGVMTDALYAGGGLLDKYTGDGLMAMFRLERNATVAGAVETALAMRDATLALSRELKAEGEKSLRVGISMHAGEAVVGLIGNSERQVNFTALGHTVVVAARLQSLTGGGEVVVSEEIREVAGDVFTMESRPAVQVKGVSKPVHPYVVLGR